MGRMMGLVIALGVGILATGCTAPEPQRTPTSAGSTPREDEAALTDAAVGWLTVSTFALRTWDEHCGPYVEDIRADGQKISLRLNDFPTADCTTASWRHGLFVEVPSGVDASRTVDVVVTDPHGDVHGLSLPGLETGETARGTAIEPTAAVAPLEAGELAVLTWSACLAAAAFVEPVGENLGQIRFEADESTCAGDIRPQVSIIDVPDFDDDAQWWMTTPDGETTDLLTRVR